jgi:hypothetical protein
MRFISRSALGVLVVVFAMSAVASTSAFATSTNNPQWSIAGELLGNGKNAEVTANGSGAWRINTFGISTECTSVKAKSGAVLTGTAAPVAGTSSETLVFKGCGVPHYAKCKIDKGAETIATEPLTGTLAFLTKEAAEKEKGPNVVILKPATGKVFIHFIEEEEKVGTGECPFRGEEKFQGEVALKAPEGETLKIGHTFTSSGISMYFENSGGKTLEKKSRLTFFEAAAATMEGEMKAELASKESWSIFG